MDPLFWWSKLILYGATIEWTFKAHVPYFDEIIDEWTKATQLAEAILKSEGFNTGQEDMKVGTLEEYVVVLLFKLLQRKLCVVEIVLRVGAEDLDNGAPILVK